MHLFKNKTKDVKQFLQQMKANKTNRSSNQHSLDKTNKTATINTSKHSQDQYYHNSNPIANVNNKQSYQRRSSMNNSSSVNSRQSNQSNLGSINTTVMRFNSIGGNKFYPSPPQPVNQRQGYDQSYLRMQEPRHLSTQIKQFQQDYMEPMSQAISYDIGNNLGYYSINQRRVNSFDDTKKGFHNQPYNNLTQPMRSQNFSNSHDLYGFRKNPVEAFPISQHSNTTNYSTSQQHQNGGKNYQNFQKPLFKHEPSSFMTQSSNHHSQKMNEFEIQKNHFNNSQQIYNPRFNHQKPFASQVSNFDYEMSEICEAEAGLSTEKDSPAKLTEFLSQDKNVHSEQKETPIKKFGQSNIFQILEDERNTSQSKEKNSSTQNDLRNESKKPSHKKLCLVEKNIELKHIPVEIHKISRQDQGKQKKIISVSQGQRMKLSRSFHRIDCSYMQVDRLLKETSILFSNIQRASDEFNRKLRIKGKYAKYLGENIQKQHQQMEIQSPLQREGQTLKKPIHKSNNLKDFQQEKTFKKDRRVKEIQI